MSRITDLVVTIAKIRVGAATWGWVLVALGTGLRLWWALHLDPAPIHDARWYVSHAQDLAMGRGYQAGGLPTAFFPVGYCGALAAAFLLFGPELVVGRLLNVALAAVTLSCLHVVARRATGSAAAGALAVLLFALYPADVAYTSLLVSEPLFNALTLAGAACLLALPCPRFRLAAAGLCFGLASLTRAHGLLLPAIMGVGTLPLARGRWKHSLVAAGALYLVVGATLAPWCLRNADAFGELVLVSNNGGYNLYIGNNLHATGGYRLDRAVKAPLSPSHRRRQGEPRRLGGLAEVVFDRRAATLAKQYIWEHPATTAARWPVKAYLLFATDHTAFSWNRVPEAKRWIVSGAESADRPIYAILWCLALLGLATSAMARRSIRSMSPLALPWLAPAVFAAFTAVHLVTFGNPRYHHVMMPWVALLGGYAVAAVARWLARPRAATGG
jgi:hypothetical protein